MKLRVGFGGMRVVKAPRGLQGAIVEEEEGVEGIGPVRSVEEDLTEDELEGSIEEFAEKKNLHVRGGIPRQDSGYRSADEENGDLLEETTVAAGSDMWNGVKSMASCLMGRT